MSDRSAASPVRIAVAGLALSVAAFAGWIAKEGDGPMGVRADGQAVHKPYIPTKGDVPTIGHGSTRYEDGTPVRLTDAPITRARAQQLHASPPAGNPHRNPGPTAGPVSRRLRCTAGMEEAGRS